MTESPISQPSPGSTVQKRRGPSVWDIYFPRTIDGHHDAIYVATFPEIIYFWPTIVTLFLCAFLQGLVGLGESGLGWLAISVFSLNLLVLVQDFDQRKFVIFTLSLVAFFMAVWIINLYGFTFLKSIAGWILGFQPAMSIDAYLLFGTVLLLLFAWGVTIPLFSYWRLEQNEFVHFTRPIGKDMSIARTGCTIYKDIPDVFECALGFGAGSLVIRKDSQILATIPHIPFLTRRMVAIEHMLSETRVIIDTENK